MRLPQALDIDVATTRHTLAALIGNHQVIATATMSRNSRVEVIDFADRLTSSPLRIRSLRHPSRSRPKPDHFNAARQRPARKPLSICAMSSSGERSPGMSASACAPTPGPLLKPPRTADPVEGAPARRPE